MNLWGRCPQSITFQSIYIATDTCGVHLLRNSPGHAREAGAKSARQYHRLLRFVRGRLADEQDARELAQEAYLRLLRASQSKLINDPEAYLYRIARNLLYEWYTSLPPPNEPLEESELPGPDLRVEESVEIAQQIDRLNKVLTQLSPKCRAVVLMHRRDGMTYAEIGAALGISSSMVKKYLSQGLAHCRTSMSRSDEF